MRDLDGYSNINNTFVPELQPKNLWVLNFYDLTTDTQDFPNHDFLIKSTNLPLFSLEIEKTNFDLIIPQVKSNYGSYSFSFYETVGFDGFNYCWNWFNSIYDFDKQLFKKDFHSKKKNATIKFIRMYPTSKGVLGFSSISNYTVIQNAQFNLLGLMIKDISDVDLDDDGEPLSFDISMEVQKIQPIIGKVVLK